MGSLYEHIKSFYGQKSEALIDENISLEQIEIEKIMMISKRRKQNFESLLIDTEGNIELENSDDDFNLENETKRIVQKWGSGKQNYKYHKEPRSQRRHLNYFAMCVVYHLAGKTA